MGLVMGVVAPLLAAGGGAAVAPPVAPPEAPLPSRGLVIVLRPQEVDEMTRMALARITGELGAARFRVQVMPLDPTREPSPQVESVAIDAHPVAAFAIAHITDQDGDTIAIWVSDRVGRRTTIQRMAIRGENIKQDAEVLALEAIELIRVSIAGLWPTPRPPAPATAPAPAAANPAPPAPSATAPPASTATPPITPVKPVPLTAPARPAATVEAPGVNAVAPVAAPIVPWVAGDRPEIAVGLGMTALRDSGGQSMQWLGALAAVARWPRGFAARASVAGLGSSATLSRTGGTADVHQLLASLGAAWFWSLDARMDVYVVGAIGAARIHVSGASTDPTLVPQNDGTWVSTGSIGLGTQVRLSQRVSLAGTAEVLWAWSRLDVLINQTRTDALLRPAALFTVALQASF
jgi:hypothetical protein